MAVTTAEVNDRAGAIEAFKHNKSALSSVESVLVDGGYTGTVRNLKVFSKGLPPCDNPNLIDYPLSLNLSGGYFLMW